MTGGFHLIDTRHPSIFNWRRVNNFHKKEPAQNYRHVLGIVYDFFHSEKTEKGDSMRMRVQADDYLRSHDIKAPLR